MNTTKKTELYSRIQKHGENLCLIFNLSEDPIKLSKALFSLENKAHRLTTDECNTGKDHSEALEALRLKVLKKLGLKPSDPLADSIFINGDPRGYAIKIHDQAAKNLAIHKDWGGFGILAPDFR